MTRSSRTILISSARKSVSPSQARAPPILAVAVSLNSLIVASAGEDGTIHFWRATSPKEMMTESQQGTKK